MGSRIRVDPSCNRVEAFGGRVGQGRILERYLLEPLRH